MAIAITAMPAAFADDAAGLLRVEVAPDAEISGEMPFDPFGDATPTNFLSGPFFGGGDGAAPDWLHVFPESFGTNYAAAFSPDGWIDPGTGFPMRLDLRDDILPGTGGRLYLAATAPARAAFREDFEQSAVFPGDIGGQNGWRVSGAGGDAPLHKRGLLDWRGGVCRWRVCPAGYRL